MNKHNGLLSSIAKQYHIPKGDHETESEWKVRIVYSICGMMAYSSLWDDSETNAISIMHLKNRTRDMLASYKVLYPELSTSLPLISEKLEDEITEQFLNSGVMYHCPNRVAPSMVCEESLGLITFQRGIPIDSISHISGIGLYSMSDSTDDPRAVSSMYGLERMNLKDLWESTVSAASWKADVYFDLNTEYLRLAPPFSHGYWVNKPDTSGVPSILRTGMKGSQLYYLYRSSSSLIEVSPLPQWQVESYNYRSLACACLADRGALPPIDFSVDGPLVHLRMNYLLPPRELAFLKLYSWPERCTTLPCDFQRKLSPQVFHAIKILLTNKGYALIKG